MILEGVLGLREKLHADPAFRESFAQTMQEALLRSGVINREESLANTQAYGDDGSVSQTLPDAVHERRAELFFDVLRLVASLGESSAEGTDTSVVAQDFANALRYEIGTAVAGAYQAGNEAIPYLLQDERALGASLPGIGMIVVVDRLKTANITKIGDIEV
ncbi:MAG: hypothetical protein JWM81_6 [Candidatus Saccharibacteria bacterium]|nr:hypothetical protein [Candidatus Saccharibacteria bacterium]